MTQGRLKHFGWGREGEGLTAEEEAVALARYRSLFKVDHFEQVSPPTLSQIELPASARLAARRPGALLLDRSLRSGIAYLRQIFL